MHEHAVLYLALECVDRVCVCVFHIVCVNVRGRMRPEAERKRN